MFGPLTPQMTEPMPLLYISIEWVTEREKESEREREGENWLLNHYWEQIHLS